MSRLRSLITACAVFVLAAPLGGQSVSTDTSTLNATPVTASAPVAAVGLVPMRMNAAVGVRAITTTNTSIPTPLPVEDTRNPAMMIVGGVALVVGSFVDRPAGTMIMIGGGLLGLYGLWQYLK